MSIVETPVFEKMVQNTMNKAMTKKSPPLAVAAWMVLKRKYRLADSDGIWGGSDAAHELGWRGYLEDTDLKDSIIDAIVQAAQERLPS